MFQTPIYQAHVELGARMVDFAGWSLPLLYSSIVEEHRWTRRNIGLFDVSHMGRLEIVGPNAVDTLECLCTRRMMDLEIHSTRYCLMCNSSGGILDDLMVSRLDDEKYYIVCNAGNREKIIDHLEDNLNSQTSLIDRTFETAMIAIQGPRVASMIGSLLPGPLAQLPHRKVHVDQILGVNIIAFRGGYTGEDGFEIVIPAAFAPMAWMQLLALTLDGDPVVRPVGLAARDTLRLEAGLPLYGHELTEQIDPISAGLDFAVDFEHEFIGKESLQKIRKEGPKEVRVGLQLATRRAARQGFKILDQGQPVGTITSGACTPTLDTGIAMGYIHADLDQPGRTVQIDINPDLHDAKIVPLPFYRRQKT